MYIGVQNDSRMNVTLALSSMYYGAIVTNYTQVTELIKDENGKINGAVIEDRLTGNKITVRAKSVINATGKEMLFLGQLMLLVNLHIIQKREKAKLNSF